VLADQVKSLDWRGRKARLIGPAPAVVVADVVAKVQALLE
jgi:mRNA-degrading endonuclease toxin of MazEF toxin-antitoxin module